MITKLGVLNERSTTNTDSEVDPYIGCHADEHVVDRYLEFDVDHVRREVEKVRRDDDGVSTGDVEDDVAGVEA